MCSLWASDVDYLVRLPNLLAPDTCQLWGTRLGLSRSRLVKVVSIIINNIMPQQLFSYSIPEVYKRDIDQADFWVPNHCMVCCKIYWIFHCNLQALHWIFATPITMVGLDLTWLWPTRVDFAFLCLHCHTHWPTTSSKLHQHCMI